MQITIRSYRVRDKKQPLLLRGLICRSIQEALEEVTGPHRQQLEKFPGETFGNLLVNGELAVYLDPAESIVPAYVPVCGQERGTRYNEPPRGVRVRLSRQAGNVAQEIIAVFSGVTAE